MVGISTGGGEVARYVARYGGDGRVAKAVLISAIPPLMLKTEANPGGLPIEVFDQFRAGMANRAQFYLDVASGLFYGFNRPGAKVVEGIIRNWWRQGMMGGAKAHYDCIKVVFGDRPHRGPQGDRRARARDAQRGRSDRALRRLRPALGQAPAQQGTLKVYKDFPHGMPGTHADVVNADVLAFLKA